MNQRDREKLLIDFENTLGNINFHKIKLAMQAVDWIWGASSKGVPSIQEMEDEVWMLFKHALKSKEKGKSIGYCASGGFVVEISEENAVTIQFVLEEQNSIDLTN